MAESTPTASRREVMQGLLAGLLAAGIAPAARGETTPSSPTIVRISRGSFAPEKYEAVKRRLDDAKMTLVPAIRDLAGCQYYYAAIDRESSSMVNVSVWDSLAHAQQMQSLAPMQALAELFTRDGVRFERPIIDYETLWTIP
jgi:quinol monooxygenase YgiN